MMRARGSALVSVILVLLVLTIVGVGIAYFTSMEDRLSGNTRIAKAGFYAADAGLRRGEALLSEFVNLDPAACQLSSSPLTLLLSTSGPQVLNVPGGGYQAMLLNFSTLPALTKGCLGVDALAFADVPIPPPSPLIVDTVAYSLYLRNNADDPVGTFNADTDFIVNLVSVGTVNLAAGVVVTKIIEEQLLLTSGAGASGGQKDVNAGGTNTVGGASGT